MGTGTTQRSAALPDRGAQAGRDRERGVHLQGQVSTPSSHRECSVRAPPLSSPGRNSPRRPRAQLAAAASPSPQGPARPGAVPGNTPQTPPQASPSRQRATAATHPRQAQAPARRDALTPGPAPAPARSPPAGLPGPRARGKGPAPTDSSALPSQVPAYPD